MNKRRICKLNFNYKPELKGEQILHFKNALFAHQPTGRNNCSFGKAPAAFSLMFKFEVINVAGVCNGMCTGYAGLALCNN